MTTPAPENWGSPASKTITWYPDHNLFNDAAGLTGLEYLQAIIEGRFPPPPIATLFGSELVAVSAGEAVFRLVPDGSMLNPLGLVHGGTLCTLMDSAIGVAVQTVAAPGVGYASIELKVSFLRPLPSDGGAIEARGKVLQVGKKIAFGEAHCYNADGKLVGHATSSLAAV
jgi:uncharacterized protein (TIGR00369 family)